MNTSYSTVNFAETIVIGALVLKYLSLDKVWSCVVWRLATENAYPYLLSVYLDNESEAKEQRINLESWYKFFKSGIQNYEKEIAEYIGDGFNG